MKNGYIFKKPRMLIPEIVRVENFALDILKKGYSLRAGAIYISVNIRTAIFYKYEDYVWTNDYVYFISVR